MRRYVYNPHWPGHTWRHISSCRPCSTSAISVCNCSIDQIHHVSATTKQVRGVLNKIRLTPREGGKPTQNAPIPFNKISLTTFGRVWWPVSVRGTRDIAHVHITSRPVTLPRERFARSQHVGHVLLLWPWTTRVERFHKISETSSWKPFFTTLSNVVYIIIIVVWRELI